MALGVALGGFILPMLIGNVIGLLPTLLTGLATDLFGVIPVAVGIAVMILTGGFIARNIARLPT